jgi:hypothetical protein
VDPKKVEAIMEWHASTNILELRSFMGSAGYYRRFIEGFSEIAIRLRNCKRKTRSCMDREMRGSLSKAQGFVDDGFDTKGP